MTVELIAYPFRPTDGWTLEPAPLQRDWMDQTPMRAAYRCLPMALANQAGWIIGCPATFKATWNGKNADPKGVQFSYPTKKDEQLGSTCIGSPFASGTISFIVPWLFRTSERYGLWVRGPTNAPRSDVHFLEGLVETDWSPFPFTMNWKIMRPKVDVWFKKGDPVCMVLPYPIALLEEVKPRVESFDANPDLQMHFEQAKAQRISSIERRAAVTEGKWELSYTRGTNPDGVAAPEHRTNLKLAKFEELTD